MFSVTYFKYFLPFVTIVVWYIIFQKFEIPWSTILFCPPIIYIIYKLLDFNGEDNAQENEESPHKGSTSKNKNTECMNSSENSDKGINKEEFIQDISAISQFIHDFIPHAKNLYLAIFRPKKVEEAVQEADPNQAKDEAAANGEATANGEAIENGGTETTGETEATSETEATGENTADATEINIATPSNPQFQKTEMAMNLFKRVYIAFTQGKVLRPTDTPLQRLCWAVFSNKDEFINFIDVVSDSKEKVTAPEPQVAETNVSEIKPDETEDTITPISDSESSVAKDSVATDSVAVNSVLTDSVTINNVTIDSVTKDSAITDSGTTDNAATNDVAINNATTNKVTTNYVTETAEAEAIRTKTTESETSESEVETIPISSAPISSAYVRNRVDTSAEEQTSLTAEFNKQAYFLWGFIQAEYIDYDLSLITEYPFIRILCANQLLIEITQELLPSEPTYKLKIYQAPSQCISIEIDDMQKVRLYNSVIKFVLDNHLLKG